MKSCQDIQSQLADFVAGALEARERAALESHLQECPVCRHELQALQRVGRLLDVLPPEEATAVSWQSIRRAIEPPEPEPVRARGWAWCLPIRWPRMAYAGLAAAAAAVALVLFVSYPLADDDDETQDFIQRHSVLAWNDPLSDKAALGAMLGRNEAERKTP